MKRFFASNKKKIIDLGRTSFQFIYQSFQHTFYNMIFPGLPAASLLRFFSSRKRIGTKWKSARAKWSGVWEKAPFHQITNKLKFFTASSDNFSYIEPTLFMKSKKSGSRTLLHLPTRLKLPLHKQFSTVFPHWKDSDCRNSFASLLILVYWISSWDELLLPITF